MGELVTDPNDPRLGHGVDKEQIPQHEVYLVLSEEERAKGFIRPVRTTYVHVGNGGPKNFRYLTPDEEEKYKEYNYILYEEYPKSDSAIVGRYWTQEQLDAAKGCGVATTMSSALAETYARNPNFYGATYCCGCRKHLPVEEFVWSGTNEKVGS